MSSAEGVHRRGGRGPCRLGTAGSPLPHPWTRPCLPLVISFNTTTVGGYHSNFSAMHQPFKTGLPKPAHPATTLVRLQGTPLQIDDVNPGHDPRYRGTAPKELRVPATEVSFHAGLMRLPENSERGLHNAARPLCLLRRCCACRHRAYSPALHMPRMQRRCSR